MDTDRLERVIQDTAANADMIPPGMWLSKWIVVGFCQDPADPTRHGYVRLYPQGTIPPHEAIGLLQVAADMVLDTTREGEE